ncbi:MAG: hypothetical protein KDE62_14200, partial [Calditrichaeota bacterium]|nr:hypothetical protein [Calditrichota bacterium]MCB0294579.1 hypothetical protein [Calditrichota bacterium]
LIVLAIVMAAAFYTFRHLRHTLTVGEKDSACNGCPIGNPHGHTRTRKPSPLGTTPGGAKTSLK